MHTLEIYQSLWAMEARLPNQAEPSPEVHFKKIADAGYDGICLDPNVGEIADALALAPLFRQFELKCMINAFPNRDEDLIPLLEMARTLEAQQVNLISGVMPMTPAEASKLIHRWAEQTKHYSFPVLWETHRNATLNDLFFTLEVLAEVPDLKLCGDLSHFVVDREMQLPLNATDKARMDRILAHTDSLQGRISSNQQIQIPLGFPQFSAWEQQFKDWWQQGIYQWLNRQKQPQTFRFLIELGPPPYAMTDAQQQELSDRWRESTLIKDWIENLWLQLQPNRF